MAWGVPGEAKGVARVDLRNQDRGEGERCSLGRRELPALAEPTFSEGRWGLSLVCEGFTDFMAELQKLVLEAQQFDSFPEARSWSQVLL